MSYAAKFDPHPFTSAQFKEREILYLKSVFDTLDTNKMGLIVPRDLQQGFKQEGIKISKELLYSLVEEYDEGEVGGINFEQFISMLKYSAAQKQSRSSVKKIFNKYDRNCKGYITQEDIERVLDQVDQSKGQLSIQKLGGVDGRLSFQEFYNAMTSRTASLFNSQQL